VPVVSLDGYNLTSISVILTYPGLSILGLRTLIRRGLLITHTQFSNSPRVLLINLSLKVTGPRGQVTERIRFQFDRSTVDNFHDIYGEMR